MIFLTEEQKHNLTTLAESGVISTADKNLRSKIDSINRNLKQLAEKRARIDFEIKRQKKSLVRKREELKKVTTRTTAKVSLALESGRVSSTQSPEQEVLDFRKLDSILLQESSQLLEQLDS